MKPFILLVASTALITTFAVNAGVLEGGKWSPSGCGAMPEAPVIDSSSADAFNRSIGTLNAWQEKIQAYHDCMVKEANADSSAINQAATAEQARINNAVEKMNKEAAAGKQRAEQSSSSSSSSSTPIAPPLTPAPGQMY
ncbi:hypothetical protein [Nitrosovibrio sp. Nv4]|uniref:hypothetical protein n=1 Tax=Nitrosovibrio sp. Nv4 TaxID=1945880 RepID=UPI000BDAAF55|nr:hypothetical protein [Nitrosovibrio sp. Nv4]SOD41704.1 hypothetical protein SAMN06298226_2006 [Nitrosovibrio sp. Nv4]